MNKSILKELDLNGWVEIKSATSDSDLLSVAQSIGKIIPHPNGQLIFNLIPKSGNNSIKGTFSNTYGFNKFPLHTDTAFWPKPVRYLLLSSSTISSCQTTIASSTSILNQLKAIDFMSAERAIFKVHTIHNQFYTSLLFREENVLGIKYDSTCMKPVNNSAKKFVQIMNEIAIDTFKVDWNGTTTVIIDNWKMLHGRGNANANESRELKRIYIN